MSAADLRIHYSQAKQHEGFIVKILESFFRTRQTATAFSVLRFGKSWTL